jgi:hypothetical protein
MIRRAEMDPSDVARIDHHIDKLYDLLGKYDEENLDSGREPASEVSYALRRMVDLEGES